MIALLRDTNQEVPDWLVDFSKDIGNKRKGGKDNRNKATQKDWKKYNNNHSNPYGAQRPYHNSFNRTHHHHGGDLANNAIHNTGHNIHHAAHIPIHNPIANPGHNPIPVPGQNYNWYNSNN